MPCEYSSRKFNVEGIEIVATDGGKKIGNALLYILSNPNRGRKYGLLADVMIDPENRGQGTGTKLVEAVITAAKDEGCYKLLADSRFARENVHSWYEKLGFEKHGFGFRMNFEEVSEQK